MLAVRTLALSAALVAITAAGSIFAPPASAQGRQGYYCGIIRNDLRVAVTVYYQHNRQGWKQVVIHPGRIQTFYVPGNDGPRTEILLTWDSRINDRTITWARTQRLEMHGCTHPSYGRLQVLQLHSGRDIVLAR